MERLTKLAVSVQGEEKTCCVNFTNEECIYRNGECGRCSVNDKAWDKLRHYEELEEQGKLVEVVRCEDCKWHIDCICVVCEEGNTVVCQKQHKHVPKNHYCSNSERREKE